MALVALRKGKSWTWSALWDHGAAVSEGVLNDEVWSGQTRPDQTRPEVEDMSCLLLSTTVFVLSTFLVAFAVAS